VSVAEDIRRKAIAVHLREPAGESRTRVARREIMPVEFRWQESRGRWLLSYVDLQSGALAAIPLCEVLHWGRGDADGEQGEGS
jgi:hypothetical protein